MAINTSNNKVRIISTTVSGLSANSKFSDIKSPALVVNTSEGGIFYADGAGGTSLKQLAALPSHTHSGYATTTQLADYLPLTGGTMTGDIIYNHTGTVGKATGIAYKFDGTVAGSIGGYYSKGKLQSLYLGWGTSPWSAANSLSVSENALTYKGTNVSLEGHTHSYLPKSGGTINGTSYNPLSIVSNSKYLAQLYIYGQDVLKAIFQYNDNYGVGFSNMSGNDTLGGIYVKNDGTPIFLDSTNAAKTLLHSGNYSNLLAGGTINGSVTATSFIGNLTGNADTATHATTTNMFKPVNVTATVGDLNTILEGGAIADNYGSYSYWVNGPSGASYGECVQLQANETTISLAGQLFWDVNHNNTTDCTRNLWWRAADQNGWTNSKWHQIAFRDWVTNNYATTSQLADYLPKSGGEIAGLLQITRNPAVIKFNTTSNTALGYIGFYADDDPVIYKADGTTLRHIIHSGNISSQSVASATNATNASNIYINNSTSSGAFPITFVSNTTKGNQALFVSTGKALTFNPSTGVLTATKFVGDVSGNAATATSASSVVVGTGSSGAYRPIVVHSGNALYSAGTGEGKPQYCYSTGDVKAKSFTTDGGTFVGNLTGNALTATNATSATLAASANKINCPDSRNVSILPNETTVGIIADFKAKAITGLTSTYSGVITFRSYGNESDLSGGPVYQIAMDLAGIHSRTSKDASTWNTWLNILDSSNYTTYCASVGHTHSGYLTSQTWRPIKINNSQKLANSSSNALDISAGSNVTLTWDSTNNRVTIAATDTKYTHPASTSGTTAVDTSAITAATPAHGGKFTIVTGALRDASGHISKVTTQQITLPSDSNTDTKVTTSASSSKLFIIGKTDASKATASAANYNASAYIDASGYLYSGGTKVLTSYTDTKNTTGADNTTSKIFLVGPTSQTSSNGNARTYSNSSCYASGGYLYSGGTKVSVEGHEHSDYLSTSGGSVKGTITSYNIVPATDLTYNIGTSTKMYTRIYARYIDTAGANYNLRLCASGTEVMNMSVNKNVYIGGSTAATYRLQVDGSVYATNFITSSDKRLKENFSDISNAEKSLEIPFYEFDYKDDKRHSYGHIAQDVQEIFPEAVAHDNTDDDYLSLDYTVLHTIQIKALLDRIEKLEEEIKQLKSSSR